MPKIPLLEGQSFNLVTVILAVVSIVVTVYYARKSLLANRRRLSVVALAPAALLTDHSQSVSNLQLTRNGVPLSDPHIVTFILSNYGRLAIDSSSFDQGRPMRLKLGVPVIEILQASLRPASNPSFVHSADTESISLGPDVLRPSQRLTVQVLVEKKPRLSGGVLEDYFTNTETEYVSPGNIPKFRPRSTGEILFGLIALALVPLVAVLIIGAIVSAITRPNASLVFSPTTAVAGTAVEISGSGFRPNRPTSLAVRCDAGFGIGFPVPSESAYIYPLTEVVTDSAGGFRVQATIPAVPSLEECKMTAAQEPTTWGPAASAERGFAKP